jgi:hypothetical protein
MDASQPWDFCDQDRLEAIQPLFRGRRLGEAFACPSGGRAPEISPKAHPLVHRAAAAPRPGAAKIRIARCIAPVGSTSSRDAAGAESESDAHNVVT